MSAATTSATAELACVDGEVMPAARAVISVLDEGLLRGDGAFEVLRVYDGRPFALDAHLERLAGSARGLRLDADLRAVREDARALLAELGERDCCMRILVTRGGRRLAITEPAPPALEAVRLGYVTYAPTRVLDGIKSLSYGANMLAGRLARERGFDEALLVTPHGRVLEATTASFFWVRDGRVSTPPLDDHILASITRARLIELVGAREEVCSADDIAHAEEAFLASTTREVTSVGAVEDRELPHAGPVTREAARRLRAHIESELRAPG